METVRLKGRQNRFTRYIYTVHIDAGFDTRSTKVIPEVVLNFASGNEQEN